MTKKVLIMGLLLCFAGFSAKAQLYSFGVNGGLGLSNYSLSNGYVFYNTTGSSPAFHAGLFGRRYISKFYFQGELNMASGMKAKITFRRSEYEFKQSSLSFPLLIGRRFYPGNLRLYAGISPNICFGKNEIANYLQSQRLILEGSTGNSLGLDFTAGSGIDLSKFTVDIRYVGNLLGGFYYEDKNPNIRTYHRFSYILLSLGYKLH